MTSIDMDADGENEVVVLAKQDETSGLALYVVKDFVKTMLRFGSIPKFV